MMKLLSLVAALCLLLTFSSCKKCYECTDTCAYCIYSPDGFNQVFTPTYCSSDQGNDYEIWLNNCSLYNGTWTVVPADQTETEICDKPKDAESQVEEFERNGYTCSSK